MKLNYYPTTHGLFVHTEIDPIDLTNESLSLVVYLLEDSLVAPQTMGDNTTNATYVHRNIMRGCIDGKAFGRPLTTKEFNTDKGNYYVDYSYRLPDVYNAENMHILIYVYNTTTKEVYQVIEQEIP